MRNLKKFLALVLAMMMVLSLMVTANAAAKTDKTFADQNDVNSSDYAEAIKVLSALGIVKGDTGFRPGDTITRAEVSAMLYRLYTGDTADDYVELWENSGYFSDVQDGKWYNGYVNFCANNGLLKGVGGDRYDPSSPVKGYEVLVMVLRAVGYNAENEFSGSDWIFKAYGYGNRLGITQNIADGSLAGAAKREVVAELFFQALKVDTVQYTMLNNYTPAKTLIADNDTNRTNYKKAIENGLVLPVNENLLYRNWKIVGKSDELDYTNYGRPSEQWMLDDEDDTMLDSGSGLGDAGKYIFSDNDTEAALKITITPKMVYDDAVTECNLATALKQTSGIDWDKIIEVLNGNDNTTEIAGTLAGPDYTTLNVGFSKDLTTAAAHNGRTGKMDALHTTTDYIGATGRTTEIYLQPDGTYVFVYVDTFLGKVVDTSPAIKDTAGHTIKAATATVDIGDDGTGNNPLVQVVVTSDSYEEGQLVLIQTYGGGNATSGVTAIPLDSVDSPEKAPLRPEDVPAQAENFVNGTTTTASIVGAPTTERVTIKGTVGARDAKMGIISTGDKPYMASNTFLASRTTDNASGVNYGTGAYTTPGSATTNALTVLHEYYDVDTAELGITNSMIGRTYDLILDHHGYIIGMKEVLNIADGVGVITGFDTVRIGTGKYLTSVEAFMTDGQLHTFEVVRMTDTDSLANPVELKDFAIATNPKHVGGYYGAYTESDTEWMASGSYGKFIGVGSLVKFKQTTIEGGYSAYYIEDWAWIDGATGSADSVFGTPMATNTNAYGSVATGVATDSTLNTSDAAITGVTNTLDDTGAHTTVGTYPNHHSILDSQSVIFVAEYDYAYNTGNGNNAGSNSNKTYKVYDGFKAMPTVSGASNNVLWQQLQKTENRKYVLVYAADPAQEYIIREQPKITVDESYLVLSRNATYAAYSEYTVLKNGVEEKLLVSNSNDVVNQAIEQAMAAGDLIAVTGRNISGYVTAAAKVDTLAFTTPGEDLTDAGLKDSKYAENAGSWFGLTTTKLDKANRNDQRPGAANTHISQKNDVLTIVQDTGNNAGTFYLTIADGCKVLIVNRDLKTTTVSSVKEAVDYANGVNSTTVDFAQHDLVYELNEFGYVCTIYVID